MTLKLAFAVALGITGLIGPALAGPPTTSTACLRASHPAEIAVAEAALGQTLPPTIPGSIGGINQALKSTPLSETANNLPQLIKGTGVSPSDVNRALHACR